MLLECDMLKVARPFLYKWVGTAIKGIKPEKQKNIYKLENGWGVGSNAFVYHTVEGTKGIVVIVFINSYMDQV